MSPPTMETAQPTTRLKEFALLAAHPSRLSELFAFALDTLSEAIPCELANLWELRADELIVRCARGPSSHERLLGHRLALDEFPNIRAALGERRTRVLRDSDSSGAKSNPYGGKLELARCHACLLLPLVFGDRLIGALTFDCQGDRDFDDGAVELATTYAHILALALTASEQAAVIDRQRPGGEQPGSKWPTLNQMQSDYIRAVLVRTGGKIYGPRGAAKILDIKPSTLQSRMQKLGIERVPSKTRPDTA